MSCPLSQPEKDSLRFFLIWMQDNDVRLITQDRYSYVDGAGKAYLFTMAQLIEKYDDYQS